MRTYKYVIAVVMTAVSVLFALSWKSSYKAAVEEAEKNQSPLLMYFYADGNEKSIEFESLIKAGLIDFLSDTFVMYRININNPSNEELIKKYGINYIPVFILEDYEPERRTKMDVIIITAENLFKGLYELYTNMASNYAALQQYDNCYGCLKLIENIPGELGINIKQNMKEIEPKVTKKISVKDQNENKEKAETYMKTAENNLKNNNFDKAYIYFSKVTELVQGSELGKKAEAEMKKIEDKVDKSILLKK